MSIWFSFGFVGVGYSGGLFPELRCGVFAVGCCRGAIGQNLRRARGQISAMLNALGARP